jgi:hypothetical protein
MDLTVGHGGAMARQLWGAHGTCASRADAILQDGFRGAPGRAGDGVYFWTMVSTDAECRSLAHRLALRWAQIAAAHGTFRDADNPTHEIVEVEVNFDSNNVISLDEPSVFFRLWSMLRKKIAEAYNIKSDEDWQKFSAQGLDQVVHGGVELFIETLEELRGRKFQLVFKNQACSKFNDILIPFLGHHSCFVVRDPEVVVKKSAIGREG